MRAPLTQLLVVLCSCSAVLLALAMPAPAQAALEGDPARPPASRFAIHAEHLIDGRAARGRGPAWVIVSGDTIEAVRTSAPAGMPVTDLGTATLLPGLID